MVWPLALLLAAQSVFPAKIVPKTPEPGLVLARVNGVAITAADAAPFLWEWRGKEVVEDLIAYHMALQEATKLGVSVSDEEIEKDIERRLGLIRQGLQQGQTLEDALQAQGFGRSRFYVRLKSEMLLDRIALATFQPTAWVRVSAIVVPVDAPSGAEVARATARANEAYEKLGAGGSWADVMAGYGLPSERQGLLDWMPIAEFPQPAQTQFASLARGGYTRPTQTARGIEVFRLDVRGAEATADELELLRQAHLARFRPAVVERIRRESKVERPK